MTQKSVDENLTKPNLEHDLEDCTWLRTKLQDRAYAQNLYAAMCNMQWQKQEVWPVLTDELWGCSWRYSGGMVARLRRQGEDYMDYYCSGMGGCAAIEEDLGREDELEAEFKARGHVPEGEVTEEIAEDLLKLGWVPVPYNDNGI